MVFYASFSEADLIIILYGYEASWPAIMLVGFALGFTYGYCGMKGVELSLSILGSFIIYVTLDSTNVNLWKV
jgi:hypothetical protein